MGRGGTATGKSSRLPERRQSPLGSQGAGLQGSRLQGGHDVDNRFLMIDPRLLRAVRRARRQVCKGAVLIMDADKARMLNSFEPEGLGF